MSEWPKRYDDKYIGEVVKLEDFERLLDHYAKNIIWNNHSCLDRVKQEILAKIQKDIPGV
jgi:hypothetical protein